LAAIAIATDGTGAIVERTYAAAAGGLVVVVVVIVVEPLVILCVLDREGVATQVENPVDLLDVVSLLLLVHLLKRDHGCDPRWRFMDLSLAIVSAPQVLQTQTPSLRITSQAICQKPF
jgi:hypothetical protein